MAIHSPSRAGGAPYTIARDSEIRRFDPNVPEDICSITDRAANIHQPANRSRIAAQT